MAIAFDAASETVGPSGSSTSFTLAHTVSGSDRILLVGVSTFDSPYDSITGVTYNGVSMTQIGKRFRSGGRGTYLYYLVAPDTGTNNIVVSSGSTQRVSIDGASFTGVAQTGQPEASSTQETASSTKTMTLSVTTDQSILVGSVFTNRDDSASTNTTRSGTGVNNVFAYNTTPVGTGSRSIILTQSDATWSVMVYAVIKPASAGASPTPTRMLMGMGT